MQSLMAKFLTQRMSQEFKSELYALSMERSNNEVYSLGQYPIRDRYGGEIHGLKL